MRLGIYDHLGWAVAVIATAQHQVLDRRRIEMVEPGMASAPIHHEGTQLDDVAAMALVESVRASAVRATSAALDALSGALDDPISSMAIRALPERFPTDIATLRRAPYEARADAVMYREVLVVLARERRWRLSYFDARTILDEAARHLGDRADEVLHGPRSVLGPPWTKDHRMALAATVLIGH